MRVLISVDMEGIAGVTGRSEVSRGTDEYQRFRKLMTEETNAAIRGAFNAGADSVVVNDSHGSMRNILYDLLDDRAELISGANKPLCMVQGVEDADVAAFIGYHAMAGSFHGVMDHTISSASIYHWKINGNRVAEADINAALCGFYQVPVVLVAGDDALMQHLAKTLPETRLLPVKFGMDQYSARSLSRSTVLTSLEKEMRLAIENRHMIAPVHIEGPVTCQIDFSHSTFAETACLLPLVRRVDARTVEVAGKDIIEAWRLAYATVRLASTTDM